MTLKHTLLISLLAILIASTLLWLTQPHEAKANVFTANVLSVATTSAAFSITTSARILSTTTNALGTGTSYTRMYAAICTPSTVPVAINLDADKAANGSTGQVTAWIAAAAGYQNCYYISDINQYSGSVTASSTGAAAQVTVKEYTFAQ